MKAVNRFLRTLLLMSVLLICCGATHALADDPPVTITQPKAWSAWSYDDTSRRDGRRYRVLQGIMYPCATWIPMRWCFIENTLQEHT